MSDKIVDAILQRVNDHCCDHNLTHFEFIFHGGEPLLAGKSFYEKFIAKAKNKLLPAVKPIFSLQTNGVLLTEEWCEFLGNLQVNLGISLDGTADTNDKFRVDHYNKGSYKKIVKGLQTAQNSRYFKKVGILSVIDVSSDPFEVYDHFKALSIATINFLFPYGTHDRLPPKLKKGDFETPYADWLISIFDRWYDDEPPKPKIQLFEQIIVLILGVELMCETLGKKRLEFLVIETDGSIEASGALKVCGHGFTKAGLNITQNDLKEVFDTNLGHLYHFSHHNLCEKCQQCPIVQVCGGGFLPHRFNNTNGFNNPSVFCLDLMKLITHIQNKLFETMPDNKDLKREISPISFREMSQKLQTSN